MKLKTKFLLTLLISIEFLFIIINTKETVYDQFIEGLGKSFEIKDDLFKECFNKDWKSGQSADIPKSKEKYEALEKSMIDIKSKISGDNIVCQFKNKIKSSWFDLINKTNKKAESEKAKKDAAPAASAPKKSFLQVSLNIKRTNLEKKKRTKWGIFSILQPKIKVLEQMYRDWASTSFIGSFVKILECIAKNSKADYKAKNAVDSFKGGIKNIKAGINGFIDFFVNFVCDKYNFEDASDCIKKGKEASSENDKWKNYGCFTGKVYESIRDNNLVAR